MRFGARQIISWGIATVAIITIAMLVWLWRIRDHRAPTIPPYPNVVGVSATPNPFEAQFMGEANGGFTTPDSSTRVWAFYDAVLQEQGWDLSRDRRWYRTPAGYCYTVMFIQNDPFMAKTPPGMTSFVIRLRQAFTSELGTTAPPGCK